MQIFLDTNVIITSQYFRSDFAKLFLKSSHLLGYKIIIPEVVFDEVIGNYKKDLIKKSEPYLKACKDLEAVINDIDVYEFDIEQLTDEYEDFFIDLLEQNEVDIPDYPKISPKDLVEAEYRQLKPFKTNGEGHKDYLIWKTITSYKLSKDNIYLATNNPKDFCADQIKGEDLKLHPDLVQQIRKPAATPKIINDLRKFFNDNIQPSLEGIELKDIAGLTNERIEESANMILLDKLGGYQTYNFAGLHFNGDVTIDEVGEGTFSSISYKKIDGNEILISIDGTIDVEIDGFIDQHEFYTMSDRKTSAISIVDRDWNDHVMSASTSEDISFKLSMAYSREDDEIAFVSLSLPDEIGIHEY